VVALRDYQETMIVDARKALRNHKAILITAPTGSGKTCLASFMIKRAAAKGLRAWMIVNRDFLLTQTASALDQAEVSYGYIASGREFNPHKAVQIASIDTLRRRLDRLEGHAPDLVVWDEAHHLAAVSWRAVKDWIDRQTAGNARSVGLSASPARLDGRGLGDFFGTMVRGPSVAWLIERGFLSGYRAFAPTAPVLDGVHTRAGDYARGELAAVMDTDQIAGNIVGTYKEHANGKRAIYFAVSVEHSKHIAAAFCAAGVAARHLDASSSSMERIDAAQSLAAGALSVLINVDLFGEGYDLSSQAGQDVSLGCVGLCRPTQSLALHLQQVGRALRPKPEPAIILDHAGNCMRHGLPDDERDWTLAGQRRGNSRNPSPDIPIRRCGECFAVFSPREACPFCGTICEPSPREVTEVAIDMAEVNRQVLQAQKRGEQRSAKSLEDLQAIAAARGYKPGWARHIWEARTKKRAHGAPGGLREAFRASVGR
jgi:DNA repair protein RadD